MGRWKEEEETRDWRLPERVNWVDRVFVEVLFNPEVGGVDDQRFSEGDTGDGCAT